MTDDHEKRRVAKTDHGRRRTDGVCHTAIVEKFTYREWAKRIALMLLEIEKDEVLRATVESIIVAIAAQARYRNPALKERFKVIK